MLMRGARVLAQWPAERDWWYPGTVVSGEDEPITVVYDDGDRWTLQPEQVELLALGAGARVYGRWKGGKSYYPGRIAETAGNAIRIDYDDGDREWTTLGMVRVNVTDR